MIERTIRILTTHIQPHKTCVMGNEAIARAALEAGVSGVFSYPGTPSTEISEIFNHIDNFQNQIANQEKYPSLTKNPVYFEYSINEKIAMEKAIAFSIGNCSAMCVMKNVGMNVASDPLMTITYQTIGAPLVIIVCDDPGCHSSSNEQDSRHWGPMASVPVFNPSTPAEAFSMVKQAFDLSEKLKLPVIVRTTTRVSHTRGIVTYGNIYTGHNVPGFERKAEHINIPAKTAAAHGRLLNKLKSDSVLEFLAEESKLILSGNQTNSGIISSGVAKSYLTEILYKNNASEFVQVLDLGLIHPFPEKEVLTFLKKGFSKILILEELDPFIENNVRIIAQKNNISIEISGKGFSELLPTGEFSLDLISKVLEDFLAISFVDSENIPLTNFESFIGNLPARPPALCAGCPHRATFYALKLAIPRDQPELIMCGDIGCFGLGALPPLKMIDTINHMGMSISMAQGLYEAFHSGKSNRKIIALVGDGTFFHSGISSLVNAIYTKANVMVVIFDNRTIGMTGHQDHPGASHHTKYHEIELLSLLSGLGVECVESINPFDLQDSFEKINTAMLHDGVSVVVAKAPCIFLPEFDGKKSLKGKIIVDEKLCNTCTNHADISIYCSRCYSPKNNISRAKAKLVAEISVPGESQSCPANICNHGFFNSILEGDYKSAIEIVRDKMLFARTCGDICHRPCEIPPNNSEVVPIRKLKKFVSSMDDLFLDFNSPIKRAQQVSKKNKSVAIVGAGPAGLSAAYDLIQTGYNVTIFEKENLAGGIITYAIPDFRMDKTGFQFEAMQLQEMGVQFEFDVLLGRDIFLDKLADEFDSVILAIGTGKSKELEIIINNVSSDKYIDAISFLRKYHSKKSSLIAGTRILVIGGGNAAIDSARCAKKMNADNIVIVSCLETFSKAPAFSEEIQHAVDEGVIFMYDSYADGCQMQPDDSVMVRLHAYSSKEFIKNLDFNYIITAIGQTIDTSAFSEMQLAKFDNVFTAGDVKTGNHKSVIGAIASGKKAAIEIRQLLEGYQYEYEGEPALSRLNSSEPAPPIPWKLDLPVDTPEDINIYNLFQACKKCNHCIDNFGCPAMIKVNDKVQIDMSRCNLCGLCIDVCPNNAIKWEEMSSEII